VASTKAFTTQLVLYLFALKLAEVRGTLSQTERCEHIGALMQLPQVLEDTLKTAKEMEEIAASSITDQTSSIWAAESTIRSRSKAPSS
jgi:glucosamine 6-phosphate synthetase-like amidotransferase/phosphosugar isomerase protein